MHNNLAIIKGKTIPVIFEIKNVFIINSVLQVVSQNSGLLAPLAVDAVLHIADPATESNADLNNIKVDFPAKFCLLNI
jgi:hypothetical protein